MSRPTLLIIWATGVITASVLALRYLDRPKQHDLGAFHEPGMQAVAATDERKLIEILAVSNPKQAEQRYREFVVSYGHSSNKREQDEVGLARIRLGYLIADRKDFEGARKEFQTASTSYKGTGRMNGDFGGIPDGAEYQADVCLVAEGKKGEARAAFLAFLKNRPDSPLAKAAYRRLVMLNGGKSLPEYENLLQKDISAQQKKAAFETASCGPRSLAYLLPLLGKPKLDYEELAKLCETGRDGTSLDGMRMALKSLKINSWGVQVNRQDFARIPTPALLLSEGHYQVLTQVKADRAILFDPLSGDGSETEAPLPPINDPTFSATVLVLSLPEGLFQVHGADDEGPTKAALPPANSGYVTRHPVTEESEVGSLRRKIKDALRSDPKNRKSETPPPKAPQ